MSTQNHDWRPDQYLAFDRERTQASIDLVSRIALDNPKRIIDIGCGPGNSSAVLKRRWPDSHVCGIDSSPAMIEAAKKQYPDQQWVVADAAEFVADETYDIVFSNATIQWIPDHSKLMRKFAAMTNQGGCIAIQMPLYHEMPVAKLIDDTFHRLVPDSRFRFEERFTFHDAAFYYDALAPLVSQVSIWVTVYHHVMDSHDAIFAMMETTGLRPYYEALGSGELRERFIQEVKKGLGGTYPPAKDGKVLYPFRRLFIVGQK